MRRRTFLIGVAALPVAGGSPPIRTCEDWGARPPQEPLVLVGRPVRILIHHTATANSDDLSIGHAYELARWIQDLHMDTNGWADSGQHFTISRGGVLMEGRHGSRDALEAGDRMVVGAHCPGQNDRAIGIENEGIYMDTVPPQQQWDSLVQFCAHVCDRYNIPTTEIFGHRDFFVTQCPGDALYAMLPRLRSEVAAQFR
ncbi:hypothetical protein Lesp02_66240 [Lentzea sp. NBRC 105346]|uniref:peptidoglycan recognition protein family protein n=1 Tax=Lentzea sp. NBRC 105346 TaxID=3032205 RepID=UPI0024A4EC62|nr:peptidoglycan recognition family protein [Lentzea sp. NBRC 105346]GLZ34437.1 hypothetical protein Lesp02_66240 [Lentzea sp. NBRC 105346]